MPAPRWVGGASFQPVGVSDRTAPSWLLPPESVEVRACAREFVLRDAGGGRGSEVDVARASGRGRVHRLTEPVLLAQLGVLALDGPLHVLKVLDDLLVAVANLGEVGTQVLHLARGLIRA